MTCDAVLDYVYGELQGEALEQYRAHLAGCEKCQAEVASMQRVRAAVGPALAVEGGPSEERLSSMSASLLAAAAARRGSPAVKAAPRGKVLQLFRTVATHPGYAAAAGLLIVGGAIGWQFSRGHVLMPRERAALEAKQEQEQEQEPQPQPQPQPQQAPAAAPATPPAPPPPAPAPTMAEPAREAEGLALDKAVAMEKPKAVQRKGAPAPAKKMAKEEADSNDALGGLGDVEGGVSGGVVGGVAGGGGSARGKRDEQIAYDSRARASSSAPAAAAPARVAAPEAPAERYADEKASKNVVAAPVTQLGAAQLAAQGQCDAAIRAYADLARRRAVARLRPEERVHYVKCLRETQHYQAAQQQLDALRREKTAPADAVAREQRALDAEQQAQGQPPLPGGPAATGQAPAAAKARAKARPSSETSDPLGGLGL